MHTLAYFRDFIRMRASTVLLWTTVNFPSFRRLPSFLLKYKNCHTYTEVSFKYSSSWNGLRFILSSYIWILSLTKVVYTHCKEREKICLSLHPIFIKLYKILYVKDYTGKLKYMCNMKKGLLRCCIINKI